MATEEFSTSIASPEVSNRDDYPEDITNKNESLKNVEDDYETIIAAGDSSGTGVHDEQGTNRPTFSYNKSPRLVGMAQKEYFRRNNYLRGCKWSSDGAYLLTNSEDHTLRVLEIPDDITTSPSLSSELKVEGRVKEPEVIYDFCWLETNGVRFVLSSSKSQPIHISSPVTGRCQATYKAHNHVDEPVTAHSLCVNELNQRIYAGYVKCIRVFDVERPGKNICERKTCSKKSNQGQKGIISCMEYNQSLNCYAAGCFDKSAALYDCDTGKLVSLITGHTRGITHLTMSKCGRYLYTGVRMGSELFGWDLRNLSQKVYQLERSVSTNQRFSFHLLGLSDEYLASGHDNGVISIWSSASHPNFTASPAQTIISYQAHLDACTSVSIHPNQTCIATGSGQRRVPLLDDDLTANERYHESCVRIWSFRKHDSQ